MIQLKNISFSAENEDGVKEILKDITMDIDDGFLAITGPNGGGKSTLAKIIAGIISIYGIKENIKIILAILIFINSNHPYLILTI